jgi:hypothetical protein
MDALEYRHMGEQSQNGQSQRHPPDDGAGGQKQDPFRSFHPPYIALGEETLGPRPGVWDQHRPEDGQAAETDDLHPTRPSVK